MPATDFILNLGNSVYLDSAGRLTTNIPEGVATFSLSQPLPIPREAVQQVFGASGSVVPQLQVVTNALGKVSKELRDSALFEALGLTKEVAEAFGSIADVATTLGTLVPYVNIAVAIFKSFESLVPTTDPTEALIKQEFARLNARMDEKTIAELMEKTTGWIDTFEKGLGRINTHQQALFKPKRYRMPGEWDNAYNEISEVTKEVADALLEAIRDGWTVPFHSVDYFNNWHYLNRDNVIFTMPSAAAPLPAQFPPEEEEPFDHRPMVPLVAYGILSYLSLIRTQSPTHRTTGEHADDLRSRAKRLSEKLSMMRTKTLARTIYSAGVPWFSSRSWFVLAVGALDLRTDTDVYMSHSEYEHPGLAGNLHLYWTPPPPIDIRGPQAVIGPGYPPITMWTIDPVAVDLANQESERQYAALLTRSGYFTLAHLEALMRHLSTEPSQSETVTGNVETWRAPRPRSTVSVTSDEIPFSAPIVEKAAREPQDCKAFVQLTTQPVPSSKGIAYRLRLLTLPDGSTEMPFDRYVRNSYVPRVDAVNPGNWDLRVNINESLPLDPVGPNERELVDSLSPEEPIHLTGTATLHADTFDWYVAEPENPILTERLRDGARLSVDPPRGFNADSRPMSLPDWTLPKLIQTNVGSAIRNPDFELSVFGLESDKQTWKGEKRDWRRTEVDVTWELYWLEDQLTVSLKSRPEDRNFLVYLVVEERLDSGQWLRTPVQVRFNGQLTYVPQSFFDAEEKAREHATKIIKNIEMSYTESRRPGPTDPVTGWLRPGIFKTPGTMQEFVKLARQHAPEVVERTLAEVAQKSLQVL